MNDKPDVLADEPLPDEVQPDAQPDAEKPAETPAEGETPNQPDGEGEQPAEAAQTPEETPPEEPEKPKRDSRTARYSRRIGQLSAENDELKRQLAAQQTQTPQSSAQPPNGEQKASKPKAEDFENYSEYEAALVEHGARNVLTEFEQRAEERDRTRDAEQRRKDAAAGYQAKAEKIRETIPDYDEVIETADVQVNQDVGALIVQSERGPELAYHLANNPDLAFDLNQMSPTEAAFQLGKIESGLPKAQPKTATKAPPPPEPVKGGAQPRKEPGDMSYAEYKKWREGAQAQG